VNRHGSLIDLDPSAIGSLNGILDQIGGILCRLGATLRRLASGLAIIGDKVSIFACIASALEANY
jgi:hypothetical protein